MGIKISKPDDFEIILIGSEQLKKDSESLIADGKAKFYPEGSEEAKALIGDHPELQGDIAIVADKETEKGFACLVSSVGNSVVIHCEDKIIPIKEGE